MRPSRSSVLPSLLKQVGGVLLDGLEERKSRLIFVLIHSAHQAVIDQIGHLLKEQVEIDLRSATGRITPRDHRFKGFEPEAAGKDAQQPEHPPILSAEQFV